MMGSSSGRLVLALVFFVLAGSMSDGVADTIHVGVRKDAPPFSYASGFGPAIKPAGQGPLRTQAYDGYVVHICDAAFERLSQAHPDLDIEAVPVDSLSRFEYFHAVGTARIDILCDAATVTKDRVMQSEENPNGLLASPPVYLSGTSFAKLPTSLWPADDCEVSLIGVVRETTTESSGLREILDSGVLGINTDAVRQALQANQDMPRRQSCPGLAILRGESHSDLARLLCERKLLFYAGDREIVRSSLENAKAADRNCSFELAPDTYTDERYVVLSRVPAGDDKAASYVLQFNQILSDLILNQRVLQQSFRRSFLAEPTVKLKTLFWGLTLETP